MSSIKPDAHVYCTGCQHFICNAEELSCKHEYECCFEDPEDSMPFSDRPFYTPVRLRCYGI